MEISVDELEKVRNDYAQLGKQLESERIIALLEPYVIAECDEYCEWSCECFAKYEAEHFIKLIKGETK